MGKRILIVEDDELLADTLDIALSGDSGITTAVAYSGEQADKAIRLFKPNMVILDLMMPEVDGFELLKRWKTSGLSENIPITVCTNLSSLDSAQRAINLGAHDYFVKNSSTINVIVNHCHKTLATFGSTA